MCQSKINNLPDDVLVEIYRYLRAVDLLKMRKVSVRLGKVARDKRLWMWTRIGGIYQQDELFSRVKLYRDKNYFPGAGGSGGTEYLEHVTATAEETGWIVSRVREARLLAHRQWLDGGAKARVTFDQNIEAVLGNIVMESVEEMETGMKIIQLKNLERITHDKKFNRVQICIYL